MNSSRRIIWAIVAVAVIAILVIALVAVLLSPPAYWTPMGPDRFPYWVLGFIFAVIIIGLLIRLVFWAVFGARYPWRYGRWYWRTGSPYWGGDPEDILDERYARGEITREQYMQMREDLRRGRV